MSDWRDDDGPVWPAEWEFEECEFDDNAPLGIGKVRLAEPASTAEWIPGGER